MDYLNNLKMELDARNYSKEYSSRCISYARQLHKQKLIVVFDVKHLSKLMGISYTSLFHYILNSNDFYSDFNISKSSGSDRIINAPSLNLKKIQRWILQNILLDFPLSNNVKGFRKNHSILDNAKFHSNKELVYNIDIKDFFPSIEFNNVYYMFYNVGYTAELSYAFAKLLTYENYLPQGSPASPHISNIICYKMDESLDDLSQRISAQYTRYADDMTISTNDISLFLSKKSAFKNIVNYHGFSLNNVKERLQYKNQPQFVTGLIVNNGVKVRRSFKKDIEQHIYYCEKYGVYDHLKKIGMEDKSYFKEYIYGKTHFINNIEPEVGKGFLRRLDKLKWSY